MLLMVLLSFFSTVKAHRSFCRFSCYCFSFFFLEICNGRLAPCTSTIVSNSFLFESRLYFLSFFVRPFFFVSFFANLFFFLHSRCSRVFLLFSLSLSLTSIDIFQTLCLLFRVHCELYSSSAVDLWNGQCESIRSNIYILIFLNYLFELLFFPRRYLSFFRSMLLSTRRHFISFSSLPFLLELCISAWFLALLITKLGSSRSPKVNKHSTRFNDRIKVRESQSKFFFSRYEFSYPSTNVMMYFKERKSWRFPFFPFLRFVGVSLWSYEMRE